MWLFSPAPYFRRTAALTRSAPLQEGLTKQWPGASRTQEHLWGHAVADAQSLWPGASPPQKKFSRQCSSSASGIMENHNTHLAPGFTPMTCSSTSECGCFLGSAGTRWLQQFLPNVLPSVEPLFPCGLRTSQTPLCSWRFTLPTRATPGIKLQSFRL